MKPFITFDSKKINVQYDTKQLNQRQIYILKKLFETGFLDGAGSYLASLAGKRRYYNHAVNTVKNDLIDNATDELAGRTQNRLLETYQRQLDQSRSHVPINSHSDWIGVEIECQVPYNEVCVKKVLLGEFSKGKVPRVNVKSDGSIDPDPGYRGVEVTVLTRLSRPDNLRQVCDILSKVGAKVNKSCGMHVHLDARHLTKHTIKRVGLNFQRSMNVLRDMVPASRRNNTYCALGVSGVNGSRYYAVNLTAFRKYKTIEVRLHSSTTDFQKIINWATLCYAIATCPRISKDCQDINELSSFIKIDEELMEYVAQRTELFLGTADVRSRYHDNDTTERQLGA